MATKMDFNRIPSASGFPKQERAEDNESTYGFLTTYKVQRGNTSGDIVVKGTIKVLDSDNVNRLIMGYKPGAF